MNRPLRIAQIAPLWMSVPPATYGGTELVVHLLTEELVARGHEVTLFAPGNSKTSGHLRSVQPISVAEAMERGEAYEYVHYANAIMAEVLNASRDFDVIHSHLGCSYAPFAIASAAPVLHTLHTALSVDDQWVLTRYPQTEITVISHVQAAAVPRATSGHCRVVHHGIDFSTFELASRSGEYLAFLGRMGPQKSPVDAIRIAGLAGMPIVLAGSPQNAEEKAYFAREVQPLIDGNRVSYIGSVGPDAKRDLLRRAAALLFPIRGNEAFGLAMIEAMACGTPVLALRHSSTPEIVDDGITGFVGTTIEALAGKAADALGLDREQVRRHAEGRFSHLRMANDYLNVYESIAGRAHTPPPAMQVATQRSAADGHGQQGRRLP